MIARIHQLIKCSFATKVTADLADSLGYALDIFSLL